MKEVMTSEKLMTTREVATVLGCAVNTVRKNAKVCLPNKKFENGKQTFWTEEELTVLVEFMKEHMNIGAGCNLSNNLTGCSTRLTPVYKFAQTTEKISSYIDEAFEILPPEETRIVLNGMYASILQGMNRAFDKYEAEHQKALKLLELKNSLEIELNESKEWYSIKRMESLNPDRHFNWRELKEVSKRLGCEPKDVFDQNYGTVKAYHVKVWEELYFDSLNYD